MDMIEAIKSRHSVREYEPRPLEESVVSDLWEVIEACKRDSGLNIQLVTGNPEVFDIIARFGVIHGAETTVAFVTRDKTEDERIGYWGQRIVLAAQQLGLNTCWAAMCSRRRSKAVRAEGERVRLVIAVGYGKTQGKVRKTKSIEELSTVECGQRPAWFDASMEAAQLAPTAMNNQHFHITLRSDGKTVCIEAPHGSLDRIDLGIVKRNFEEAANELGAEWRWE